MKQNLHYHIAIIYLAIGRYEIFWDEFYTSCEQYLFPDGEKYYFVFTDSVQLLERKFSNVSMIYREDRGWAANTNAKSECILSLRSQLKDFDYVFYINANYKIHDTIFCYEILPTEEDGYLAALSFDHLALNSPDTFSYDRNPQSLAYIPYGMGIRYFQGGFYGGRVPEVLLLSECCDLGIRIDVEKGIVAAWQDESYLNKYLLEQNPKVIGTCYCKPEEFEGGCKAILRDKNRIFGIQYIYFLKIAFLNPVMSYLWDKDLRIRPLHLVEAKGGLGNQMFQYAFLLSMKLGHPENNYCLSINHPLSDQQPHSSDLGKTFVIPPDDWASEKLIRLVKQTPESCIHLIREKSESIYQSMEMNWPLVTYYIGYWQTELYFERIKPAIREAFLFNLDTLNEKSRHIAKKIQSGVSVSIHFRRCDYIIPQNQCLYGDLYLQGYYQKAIDIIKKKLRDIEYQFFLFSDDPDWVKENISLNNSVVIDWNRNEDSWQDMYLMSICNHNIIANSSFSWWGAWLNVHVDKIVIAPYRWFNDRLAPDILPEGWISIYPPEYHKNNLIECLEKNWISLKEDGLFHGRMGLVIFLFSYARYYQDSFYERVAEGMLDSILNNLNTQTPIDYADGLLGIGTAVQYLIQNKFVTGNSDEILLDLDLLLDDIIDNNSIDLNLDIIGGLHYLHFRILGDIREDSSERSKRNKQNMEVLKGFVQNCKVDFGERVIDWDSSIGLKGKSGQELSMLDVQTEISWRELL